MYSHSFRLLVQNLLMFTFCFDLNKAKEKESAKLTNSFSLNAQDWDRTSTDLSTRPSNVRVYQFRHLGNKFLKDYLFVFVFELVFTVVFATLAFAAVEFTATFELAELTLAEAEFAAVFAGAVVGAVSEVVCKTETLPVIAGIDNNKAESIKVAAAVIVIFDNTD